MKKSSKDIIENLNTLIPEEKQKDDSYITLLEDIADSITETDNDKKISELENKIKTLENDKKELDKSWRDKYISRFMGDVGDEVTTNNSDNTPNEETDTAETIGIDDIFIDKE